MASETPGEKTVVTNRKALHDYSLLDHYEAGIVLKGTEVKSLRQGGANLQDGYAIVKDGEVWLLGLHINPFEKGNINNHDPRRERKLLLHKKEIRKMFGKLSEQGLTLVPLRIYFRKNVAKVELAVARGKKSYDKREAIAKRDAERRLRREYAR